MNYNKISASAFVVWGLLHVVVGLVALGTAVTGGTEAMLPFVDLDPAANGQADRISDLVVQFYQALLLIGLTVAVLGWTLNRRGEPVGLALNAILVLGIDSFFLYFEVIPGHRPVVIGVISVALFALGVGFGWLGLRAGAGATTPDRPGDPAG